eukprot:1151681-Pelagomonas_calceolata.AAC.5
MNVPQPAHACTRKVGPGIWVAAGADASPTQPLVIRTKCTLGKNCSKGTQGIGLLLERMVELPLLVGLSTVIHIPGIRNVAGN